MIVDIHTHLWDSLEQWGPPAAQWIRNTANSPLERPDPSPADFDRAMEPVTYAIILGFESRHLRASIPAPLVAKYVARQPNKYLGFAGVDPMADDWQQMLRKVFDLGLSGVTISPAGQGFHPCHTRAMRLYEKCEQLGLPIYVHPGTHLGQTARLEFSQPYLFEEPARAFPKLRLVLGQVGYPWVDQALVMLSNHPHILTDTSDLVRRPWHLYQAFVGAYQHNVMDRLLLGSDFPFCTPQQAIVTIYSINSFSQGTFLPVIPREQLRAVVERDALACLGLTKPDDKASTPTPTLKPPTGASLASRHVSIKTLPAGEVEPVVQVRK